MSDSLHNVKVASSHVSRTQQKARNRQYQTVVAAATHHLESPHIFSMCICICAIWEQAWIVPMNNIIYVVLGEQLFQKVWREFVRDTCRQH